MKLISPALLLILMLRGFLLGQASAPVTQPQTFHIKGTITDPIEAVVPRAKVTFQGERLSKTVTPNDSGVYEADLPLGDYTMTTEAKGLRTYQRPLFRVTSPTSLTFNIVLPGGKIVDRVETPATPEQIATANRASTVDLPYYGEELLPVPSSDGVPHEIYIRYTRGKRADKSHSYTGEKAPYEDPVFVAYNLFSLQADRVTYDEKSRIIEASGNVVVADGLGTTQRADAMSFEIDDGRATRLR
jgi:hypothetical protein